MHYFAHTLKGCGSVALALALTACGEETTGTSAAAATLNLEGTEAVALEARPADSANLTQSAIVAGVSSPGAGAATNLPTTTLGAAPGIHRPVSQVLAIAEQHTTSAPAAPARGAPDTVELADGSTVITTPVENARPGDSVISRPEPDRERHDELPVQPPVDIVDGNDDDAGEPMDASLDLPPVIGADPLVTLIATTDSDLNSSGTRLVWSTENVDSCTASGAWEGDIAASGTLDLQPNEAGDLTYMIKCEGASGTAMAMVTVTVESTDLAWEPPVQNTNGTQLTDLAGYNLYYGTESGRYTRVRPVTDANATNLELPVEPGTYYLAMTAYDFSGNESDLSNEIIRTVD